ncbi:MAG TPA: hypothetical protein VGE26_07320 [Sphingobacteriaceae bacterium]
MLQIPHEKLPGEFVLRFDYKDKETSTPYKYFQKGETFPLAILMSANPMGAQSSHMNARFYQNQYLSNPAFAGTPESLSLWPSNTKL